jgi:hypothetical protein
VGHSRPTPAPAAHDSIILVNTLESTVYLVVTGSSLTVVALRRAPVGTAMCEAVDIVEKRLIPAYSLGIMSRHDGIPLENFEATPAYIRCSSSPYHDLSQ